MQKGDNTRFLHQRAGHELEHIRIQQFAQSLGVRLTRSHLLVLLKLKPVATAEQSTDLLNALTDLMDRGTIPGTLHVSGGYDNSPEGKSQGYDWGFVMWFEDAAARDRYLPHPAHRELGRRHVAPICDDVAVFDFDCPTAV